MFKTFEFCLYSLPQHAYITLSPSYSFVFIIIYL
jgi:hypothetical protein